MKSWKNFTLFLDRDGVINRKLEDDYVKSPEEFEFIPNALEALAGFRKIFKRIIVVSNQQGIGKGLMTELDFNIVNSFMLEHIEKAGGKIDAVYHCPALAADHHPCRKPGIGMALQAQKDFPDIQFTESLMLGDSISDMLFAQNAGMQKIWIGPATNNPEYKIIEHYPDLFTFYLQIIQEN